MMQLYGNSHNNAGKIFRRTMSESLSLSSDSGDEGSNNSNDSDLIYDEVKPTTTRPGAYYALACVTLLNLLNYTDRYYLK